MYMYYQLILWPYTNISLFHQLHHSTTFLQKRSERDNGHSTIYTITSHHETWWQFISGVGQGQNGIHHIHVRYCSNSLVSKAEWYSFILQKKNLLYSYVKSLPFQDLRKLKCDFFVLFLFFYSQFRSYIPLQLHVQSGYTNLVDIRRLLYFSRYSLSGLGRKVRYD